MFFFRISDFFRNVWIFFQDFLMIFSESFQFQGAPRYKCGTICGTFSPSLSPRFPTDYPTFESVGTNGAQNQSVGLPQIENQSMGCPRLNFRVEKLSPCFKKVPQMKQWENFCSHRLKSGGQIVEKTF